MPIIKEVVRNSGTSVTDITVTPAQVSAGDLLLAVLCIHDDNGVPTNPTNFSIERSFPFSDSQYHLASRIATDGEGEGGLTWDLGGSVTAVSIELYVIYNWTDGGLESVVSSSSINTTSYDLDSITPSWGSEDTLFLVIAGGDDNDFTVSSYPSNYTDGNQLTAGSGVNSAHILSARRINNTTTEDPGAFTVSAQAKFRGVTIAIRDGASGSVGDTTAPTAVVGMKRRMMK